VTAAALAYPEEWDEVPAAAKPSRWKRGQKQAHYSLAIDMRDRLRRVMGGKCEKCGTTESLEFHHPNGRDWVARKKKPAVAAAALLAGLLGRQPDAPLQRLQQKRGHAARLLAAGQGEEASEVPVSSSAINRGDVVRISDRYLGQVKLAHPGIGAGDALTVTRIDKARGRACLYLRKAGRVDPVLAWPEQVVVVRRAPEPKTKGRT